MVSSNRRRYISLQTSLHIFVYMCQHVICQRYGDVRLVNGGQSSQGRVEIFDGSDWRTVCDDHWDSLDASVVCRQLGYSAENADAQHFAYFGEGTGPIFLDNVECQGTETRLIECEFPDDHPNCDHTEDAGVVCESMSGDVRLALGSSRSEGRVEVFVGHQWGTVCDNQWGDVDAAVVCRQVGFPDYYAKAEKGGKFWPGRGLDMLLDDVQCRGTESRLIDCGYSSGNINSCTHDGDAGVTCSKHIPRSPTTSRSSSFVGIMSAMGGLLLLFLLVVVIYKKHRSCGNLNPISAMQYLIHRKTESRERRTPASRDNIAPSDFTESLSEIEGGRPVSVYDIPSTFPLHVDLSNLPEDVDMTESIYRGSIISGLHLHTLSLSVCEPPPPYLPPIDNEDEPDPDEVFQSPPPYQRSPESDQVLEDHPYPSHDDIRQDQTTDPSMPGHSEQEHFPPPYTETHGDETVSLPNNPSTNQLPPPYSPWRESTFV